MQAIEFIVLNAISENSVNLCLKVLMISLKYIH